MKTGPFTFLAGSLMVLWACAAQAQSLGASGAIDGVVTDPSGATIPGARVELRYRITDFTRSALTDAAGSFQFRNLPPNPYRLTVAADGFKLYEQDIAVRSSVPISLKLPLALAGEQTTVTVQGSGSDMVENVPFAHNDLDSAAYSKLPSLSPGSGLSDAITMASPGVVADSNGFFHPLGDHGQTSYSLDGQPIGDQQSKQFSTQIPENAIQSMELITGAASAEFGDKTSLVVSAVTRSALGQKPSGSFAAQYGSFGAVAEEATLGLGNAKLGNFLVVNSLRSGRFLDTPEFRPFHDAGNNQTVFDRIDWQPGGRDSLHLNLMGARNWFQVPNSYDQPAQDQRQRVMTYNVAPGYQHTFGAGGLLTVNTFLRHDQVNYYPSRDGFADAPAMVSEYRTLTNYGVKSDYAWVHGVHNVKFGTQIMQTRLNERLALGVTDAGFNPVCLDASGDPAAAPGVAAPSGCAALGFTPNPGLQPGLVPFDLTRRGSMFRFAGKANINQFAFYGQDNLTFGNLTLTAGLRVDRYDGLSQGTGVQPRAGFSYLLKKTGTVFRGSYSRAFETPYNENLVISSSTGSGGLASNVFGGFGARPIEAGRRNQFNAGFQQSIDRHLQIDADYFWKFTDNAFDFGALLNTPLVFPISWRQSKIDGVSVRFSTPNLHGFQGFTTMGHTRARYFGPSNGGLIFNSPLETSVFRIDHDQAFQQTTYLRYQRPHGGWWAAFTWRYDSGQVAGAVGSLSDALALTAAQQSAIGFFCGSEYASLGHGITSCPSSNYGATRLNIPAAGTENADHNPPRIASRNLFDAGLGTDNLFHKEHVRTTLKFTAVNLTNTAALYNFLSTFSGTHFVAPRSYQAEIGLVF